MSRKKLPEPPPIEIKDFGPEDIERGVAKLKRRIADLEAFDPRKAAFERGDSSAEVLARDIRDTVADVFGLRSQEAQDFHFVRIWAGPTYTSMAPEYMQEGYAAGREATTQKIHGLVKRLEEKRGDLGATAVDRVRNAFRGLDLHPRIADVSTDRYDDGYYADAVFAAAKALIHYVQEKSGRDDLDGVDLMRAVFSKNNPILAFNDLKDQSELDEQEGMMHLFEGAAMGIRNPRGHSFVPDSPERALEYIAFLSMLANRVQEAKRRK